MDQRGKRSRAIHFRRCDNKCTFYGESNERASDKQHLSFYGGSNSSKKIQFNGQVTHRWGHFDLDFGNGEQVSARESRGVGVRTECAARSRSRQSASVQRQHHLSADERAAHAVQYQLANDCGATIPDRVAYKINILTFRGTYQFTKATFARLILDYNTLNSRLRSQALLGWTPSPGTAFYAGYNDDLNYDSLHPFTRQIVPGFRRNSRTFFIKDVVFDPEGLLS